MDKNVRAFRMATHSALVYGICAGLAYSLGLSVYLVRTLMLCAGVLTFPIVFLIYFGLRYALTTWDVEPDDFKEVIF